MRGKGNGHSVSVPYKGLTLVAFWQGIAFVMLLLLIWTSEILHCSSIINGIGPPPSIDFVGCSILSVYVILTGVITVGHTYIQQKNIISGLITVCLRCHKVKINQDVWDGIEHFVTDHSLAKFSHGFCPECHEKEIARLKEDGVRVEDVPGSRSQK